MVRGEETSLAVIDCGLDSPPTMSARRHFLADKTDNENLNAHDWWRVWGFPTAISTAAEDGVLSGLFAWKWKRHANIDMSLRQDGVLLPMGGTMKKKKKKKRSIEGNETSNYNATSRGRHQYRSQEYSFMLALSDVCSFDVAESVTHHVQQPNDVEHTGKASQPCLMGITDQGKPQSACTGALTYLRLAGGVTKEVDGSLPGNTM